MQTSASIDHLSEVIADEGPFSQNEGYRDPRTPAWTCFDDDREVDPELKAFRDDLLAFEEWAATRDIKDDSEVKVGMFTVHRAVRSWDQPDAKLEEFNKRMDQKARDLWLIQFYKRQMSNNDKWHRVIKALGLRMSDEDMDLAVNPILELRKVLKGGFQLKKEEPVDSGLPGEIVNPLPTVKRYARIGVNYAPGPIGGTKFVNKTRTNVQKTKGTDPILGKEAYMKNHKLTNEFVSVDRVQYEGERESHYVVGRRKTSDTTPSNYYDPEPAWKDHEGGTYAPRACALFFVETDPASYFKNVHLEGIHPDIPEGAYRLTVREFERALVAGAECYDSAEEALAGAIESEFSVEGGSYFEEDDHDTLDTERIYDGRVSLHGNMGMTGRNQSSFTDEEEYLFGIMRMIGDEHGQELMLLAKQEPLMIHKHIMSSGSFDAVVSILKFVQKDNPAMLEWITEMLCGDEKLAHLAI